MKVLSRLFLSLLFLGCSGKNYFEPKETFSLSFAKKEIENQKKSNILNRDGSYTLLKGKKGLLEVRKKDKVFKTIDLKKEVLSATLKNGLIAYLLEDNSFGIYNIYKNKKIIDSHLDNSLAIDKRVPAPLFVDNLVVIPSLDGKIIILNSKDVESSKMIYLSGEKFFNNLIHLSRVDNTLVASTKISLLTVREDGKHEYRANISEIATNKKEIFIFTKEGEVISLNKKLEVLKRKKLKFAHFLRATTFKDRVFVVDKKGWLIVLNNSLTKHKVYELGESDESIYFKNNKLYRKTEIIDLLKLSYE